MDFPRKVGFVFHRSVLLGLVIAGGLIWCTLVNIIQLEKRHHTSPFRLCYLAFFPFSPSEISSTMAPKFSFKAMTLFNNPFKSLTSLLPSCQLKNFPTRPQLLHRPPGINPHNLATYAHPDLDEAILLATQELEVRRMSRPPRSVY